MEGDFTWSGRHTTQYIDDVLQNWIPETYTINQCHPNKFNKIRRKKLNVAVLWSTPVSLSPGVGLKPPGSHSYRKYPHLDSVSPGVPSLSLNVESVRIGLSFLGCSKKQRQGSLIGDLSSLQSLLSSHRIWLLMEWAASHSNETPITRSIYAEADWSLDLNAVRTTLQRKVRSDELRSQTQF